jgi:drug efflux transport system permease protein
MPEGLKWLSYIDPLSHYLSLLRNILLKGGEMRFVIEHTVVLSLMALCFVFISFKRFHTTLK